MSTNDYENKKSTVANECDGGKEPGVSEGGTIASNGETNSSICLASHPLLVSISKQISEIQSFLSRKGVLIQFILTAMTVVATSVIKVFGSLVAVLERTFPKFVLHGKSWCACCLDTILRCGDFSNIFVQVLPSSLCGAFIFLRQFFFPLQSNQSEESSVSVLGTLEDNNLHSLVNANYAEVDDANDPDYLPPKECLSEDSLEYQHGETDSDEGWTEELETPSGKRYRFLKELDEVNAVPLPESSIVGSEKVETAIDLSSEGKDLQSESEVRPDLAGEGVPASPSVTANGFENDSIDGGESDSESDSETPCQFLAGADCREDVGSDEDPDYEPPADGIDEEDSMEHEQGDTDSDEGCSDELETPGGRKYRFLKEKKLKEESPTGKLEPVEINQNVISEISPLCLSADESAEPAVDLQ